MEDSDGMDGAIAIETMIRRNSADFWSDVMVSKASDIWIQEYVLHVPVPMGYATWR